jgi:hypothetical protein
VISSRAPQYRWWWRHAVITLARQTRRQQPMKLFLLPGGLICDAVGLTEDSESRQILRMFLNTLIWGAAGVIMILLLPI